MGRFSVSFEGQAEETLDRLTRERGTSKIDVLRDALSLEREYVDAVKRGGQLVVIEKDGSMTRLVRV